MIELNKDGARGTEGLGLIEHLQKENAELRARVNSLTFLLSEAADLFEDTLNGEYKPDSFTTQPYRTALKQTPQQSLAEIEEAAVKKYFTKLQTEYEPYVLSETYRTFDVARHIEAQGKYYAEQIRQQATEQEKTNA